METTSDQNADGAGISDMTLMSHLDEDGINNNLKTRYLKDKIYTYAGTILVSVNPYKDLPIYDNQWVEYYNGCKIGDKDPHVFAIAEAAYSRLQSYGENQACVISGESGAGKTECTKFILQYLCTVTSAANVSTWVEQQILEANTILEAFGNAKTVRNDNSSRFGKFIQVAFDSSSRFQIKGCIIQDYLLEMSRITFQSAEERNYHVFYQLVAAAAADPTLQSQFHLEPLAQGFAYLSQSGCTSIPGVDDAAAFDSLRLAMSVLNMPLTMCDGIFSVLAAILWLGNLQFAEIPETESSDLLDTDREILATIATLLQVDLDTMSELLVRRQINVRGNITEIPFKLHEAKENRHAMAKALYSRTFAWIVSYINSCTNPGQDIQRFLGVLDIFGFENFEFNSFEQLCINYTNEKLHKFFNHYVFALEQQIYQDENIHYHHIAFTDNTECLELLDKPPKCILRLLSEECRMPKGTDSTFVSKLHQEFGDHPYYVKGEDRRRWEQEFGVRHYAGAITYSVHGFLEKNKDVQQDQLFELLSKSTSPFVVELTKFQDLLAVNLTRLPAGASAVRSTMSKGKPTVADTFRNQLTSLIEVLYTTTPWYVRCIKPNVDKLANYYDYKQVAIQLHYLGMLDIIRIRREGYPIHLTLEDFVSRFRCLARHLEPLPKDLAKCVRTILQAQSALPSKEWQIGKTRVFMRPRVSEPLEERRKILINKMATVIQKHWRCYTHYKAYQTKRKAVLIIQAYYSGRKQRIHYRRMKRAAITIQAYVRGMFAREVAAALKEMRRVEEEMRRKEKEEEERRQREEEERLQAELRELQRQQEERARQEAEAAALKEAENMQVNNVEVKNDVSDDGTSYNGKDSNAAQEPHPIQNGSDVYASVAHKGRHPSEDHSLDLDEMFSFLAAEVNEPSHGHSNMAEESVKELVAEIGQQMNAVLQETAELTEDGLSQVSLEVHDVPSSPSPLPPPSPTGNDVDSFSSPPVGAILNGDAQSSTTPLVHKSFSKEPLQHQSSRTSQAEAEREIRRKQRVERRLMEEEKDDFEEEVYLDMIQYAEKYFNIHMREEGTVMKTLTRRTRPSTGGEPIPKYEMVTYTRASTIPTSHVRMSDPENVALACTIFKEVCKYLRGEVKGEGEIGVIQSVLAHGIEREELRDEILVLLVRQSTNNPVQESTIRAWVLMALALVCFHPSKTLVKYLACYFRKHVQGNDSQVASYARWCLDHIHSPKVTVRRLPPSSLEINAVRNLGHLVCRFYLMDGRTKAIDIHPSDTAADAMQQLAVRIGLKSLDGWALYESSPEQEHPIKSFEYVTDIIAQWEINRRSSATLSKYSSISKKGPTLALGGGECRFLFRKRLFKTPRELPQDPVEVGLLYAQAVHGIVKLDEFHVNERVALQLAGLQAQVCLGEPQEGALDKYTDVGAYVCGRLIRANQHWDWKMEIARAHKLYGAGKSELVAKVWYLTVVMQFPLYGCLQFPVTYKGYLSYSHQLLLGVNCEGLLLINPADRAIQNAYRYSDLESIMVDPTDDVLILNLLPSKCFIFETAHKTDIALLVASYSPIHASWLRTSSAAPGRAPLKLSQEDRSRLCQDVENCRRQLADRGILHKPQDLNMGLFRSTLRKLKGGSLRARSEYSSEEAGPLAYKPSYWAFSKVPLTCSLSIMAEPDMENTALHIFSSILAYAGLLEEQEMEHYQIAQSILDRCMKKEPLLNEMFLQLIKQTTDHPDPASRVNLRHWQLMALACSVTYPTERLILAYLQSHLRQVSLDTLTEEGLYAQFALRCLVRTLETRGRKWPPSRQEIACTVSRRPIHTRVYFLDGQFQPVEFDPCATAADALESLQRRVGLRGGKGGALGYALYEVMANTERCLLPEEKMADAMCVWERWQQGQQRHKQHFFLFKKHLFVDSYIDLTDPVEKELLYHQVVYNLRQDKFPVSDQEAVMLCALKAQIDWGDCGTSPSNPPPTAREYRTAMSSCVSARLANVLSAEAVHTQHCILAGMAADESKQAFLALAQSWPLHRAAIFDVAQSYTSQWPSALWLAVDQKGVHLLEPRSRNVLCSCEYESIVNYTPSLNSLMIVTGTAGGHRKASKYIFTTTQAPQIAQLIRDYTRVLATDSTSAATASNRKSEVVHRTRKTSTSSSSRPSSILYKPPPAIHC